MKLIGFSRISGFAIYEIAGIHYCCGKPMDAFKDPTHHNKRWFIKN